jgi:heme A synthase
VGLSSFYNRLVKALVGCLPTYCSILLFKHELKTQTMTKDTLFALSLFPYLGFLWFLTKSKQTPKLALWGFYMLLVFVAVTIPAGLYAQKVLGQSLANVDAIHGGAEFFLTLSNILVVLGFRQGIQQLREPPSP